jgi:hypothetical protein
MSRRHPDLFAQARELYTVPDAWRDLRLPEEPKLGMNRSPWREDRTPSFSIFDGGKGWKDHATDEGGDVVSFIARAVSGSTKGFTEAREWLLERIGIDHLDGPTKPRSRPVEKPQEEKPIAWPSELLKGSPETLEGFAKARGISYATAHVMSEAGLLRFLDVRGAACFAILDDANRAAEIRRMDGGLWWTEKKAYPLAGVDKSWLPGFALYEPDRPREFIITEGATDFVTAFDLVTRYEREGGELRWLPLACLGASVTNLHPEILAAMPGRKVLLVPDGDDAGRLWRETITEKLLGAGATVDAVAMPEGKDLSDIADQIKPEDLCHAFEDSRSQAA